MKRLCRFAFVLGALVASACVTPAYNYEAAVREISEPPLNTVSTASVGDIMLRQGKYAEHEGLRLNAEKSFGLFGLYTLSAGDYVKTGDKGGDQFFVPAETNTGGAVTGGEQTFLALMLRSDGQLCAIDTYNNPVCETGVAFDLVKLSIVSADAFQRTLLYSGRVGNKINIAYREFSADVARPAFNNDVEYDLSESTTIAYKGALIEVLEATNQFIRYRVVRNFNDATF